MTPDERTNREAEWAENVYMVDGSSELISVEGVPTWVATAHSRIKEVALSGNTTDIWQPRAVHDFVLLGPDRADGTLVYTFKARPLEAWLDKRRAKISGRVRHEIAADGTEQVWIERAINYRTIVPRDEMAGLIAQAEALCTGTVIIREPFLPPSDLQIMTLRITLFEPSDEVPLTILFGALDGVEPVE